MNLRDLVRGFTWKVRFKNGAEFDFWTAAAMTRAQAKAVLLAQANGDYGSAYESRDIENLWQTKG